MSMRNTSGKFSLANLGFKSENTTSHSRQTSNNYDEGTSPGVNGPSAFDKLGKRLAHTTLLPALGNKDLRTLQDVITSEKGVLQAADRMAAESQRAAVALPLYGNQEGPDLADVLNHSSTLLNHLSDAFNVFGNHQASMRVCYKKIREREEALEETRRRRRRTAQNAESAEKKLAKMGTENKGLPSQTELLERLRTEIRQLDTDIVTEEAKLGDFKRQTVKEAMSLKFGGLEELGEKLCIIGELGKLLLEEIPLEETPPGYGRAPYNGYDKTENAANEATKCLATVHFDAPHIASRPPGLPHTAEHEPLSTPHMPGTSAHMAAAEEYANYPGAITSPQRNYTMDDDVYGGISNPYDTDNQYDEFGGTRSKSKAAREVVWSGPEDHKSPKMGLPEEDGQNYEWEQQKQLDEERAREAEAEAVSVSGGSGLKAPWDPLNIRKDRNSPEPVSLMDTSSTALAPALPTSPVDLTSSNGSGFNPVTISPLHRELQDHAKLRIPPPEPIPVPEPSSHVEPSNPITPDNNPEPAERFQTPTNDFDEINTPTAGSGSGKITAAAFRKAVKPRMSENENEGSSSSRRLPVPPLIPANGNHSGSATADVLDQHYVESPTTGTQLSPPPVYGDEGSLR